VERALCPILVGRDEELAALEDALLAANRGAGLMMVLMGEAGIGKTRLARELELRARRRGAPVLWGACSEAELTLPYLPFVEAIGNFLSAVDLARLRERLGSMAGELANLFPQLAPNRSLQGRRGDAAEGKLRLFEAILELLRVAAETNGLLLVLDDVHWADGSTRELLDYLIRRLPTRGILVLALCRREELHRRHPLVPLLEAWRRSGLAQTLELRPLPAAGVGGMAEAILDRPVGGELRDFLHQRSEGNPFVLEELLKVAGERIPTASGELKTIVDFQVPPTVRDAILLRVERLHEEHAAILRTAAVLGSSFSYSTLVAVSGQETATVQAALYAFVRNQLVDEEAPPEGRYRFRHTLTREAIYEDLIGPRRAELHGRAADVLRAQPETPAVELAFHLLAAHRWEEAVPMCLQAAEEAERRRGLREAAELYERALPHVADERRRGRILCRLGTAHFFAGSPARAQQHLEDGVRLLEAYVDEREAAGYRITLGTCHAQQSRPELARREWERARQVLEPLGPSADLALACVHLASQQALRWEIDAALGLARHAVAVAEASGADGPRLLATGAIGLILARLGHADEGLAYLDRTYDDALARGEDWIAGNALINGVTARIELFRVLEAPARVELLRRLGSPHELRAAHAEGAIHEAMGEPVKARAAWEQALAFARERGAATFVRSIELRLARTQAALARFEDARRLLPKPALEPDRQMALTQVRSTIRVLLDAGDLAGALSEAQALVGAADWGPLPGRRWLFDVAVEALLLAGRIDDARQLVTSGRAPAPTADRNPYQARMEGRLALAEGQVAEARAQLEWAAEFWRAHGYREEESRTQRELARVQMKAGDGSAAEATLRAVVSAARQQGAALEAEAAERQLAELGVTLGPAEGPAVEPEADLGRAAERVVSVLFVDVRGYTEMTQKEAPHELADRLARFYGWVRREVERHHGLIDRYAGDAIMATFNLAQPRLDHSLLALRAAVAIRDRAVYEGLPLGAGLAVGPAVVGVLSPGADMSVLGDVTNLAARLQAQAGAGEVLMSEEAFRRTAEWLHGQGLAAERETLSLKGYPQPISAHRLRVAAASQTLG